jgi:hypothetical protein
MVELAPDMDRTRARDVVNSFATEQYKAITTALLGEAGEVRYQGVKPADGQPLVPPNDRYWARVHITVVDEYQETLRCDVRRFVTVGFITIQFFNPVTDSNAQPNLDIITERMRNTYRAHPSSEIEFTRPRINDSIPAESNWLRANLIADFAYRQFM